MGLTRTISFLVNLKSGLKQGRYWQPAQSGKDIDVYEPTRSIGTILFLHGMSKMGKNDPRMQTMAESMASAGFRVLLPQLPSVAKLRITKEQPAEILRIAENVINDEFDSRPKPIAIMAVSFSGVFAFKLLEVSNLAHKIGPICVIGGYFRFDSILEFLTKSKRADLYGRLLLFKNLKMQQNQISSQIMEAVNISINEGANFDKAEKLLGHLQAEHQDHYEILFPHVFSDSVLCELLAQLKAESKKSWSVYEVPSFTKLPPRPVFLLHGRQDKVIPSGESRMLARKLKEAKFPVQLCLTKFLSHGDTSISLGDLPQLWQLVKSFSWYFKHINRS